MKTGDHILTLKSRKDQMPYADGECACKRWGMDDETRATIRTAHREHVDAMAERERMAAE